MSFLSQCNVEIVPCPGFQGLSCSKTAGFEGGLFQKIFTGYIFYFLGQLFSGQLFELFARETNLKKQSSVTQIRKHVLYSTHLQPEYQYRNWYIQVVKCSSQNYQHLESNYSSWTMCYFCMFCCVAISWIPYAIQSIFVRIITNSFAHINPNGLKLFLEEHS